jgi:hypothetical protein
VKKKPGLCPQEASLVPAVKLKDTNLITGTEDFYHRDAKSIDQDVAATSAAYDRHRELKKTEMDKWVDGLVQKSDVVMAES